MEIERSKSGTNLQQKGCVANSFPRGRKQSTQEQNALLCHLVYPTIRLGFSEMFFRKVSEATVSP